jgi:hypothetical protein
MVEKDLAADVARAVARQLVVYHRRAGGQSQFSALLELEPKSDRIQSALAYAKRNLTTPFSLADRSALPIQRHQQGAVCRTFGLKRTTLIDFLAWIGWSAGLRNTGEA